MKYYHYIYIAILGLLAFYGFAHWMDEPRMMDGMVIQGSLSDSPE